MMRVPSPGRCIYCGDSSNRRTDEHILPYSLAGNFAILEDACCDACQKIITSYEHKVLSHQLGAFRAKMNAPTRKKKNRIKTLALHFAEIDEDGRVIRELGYKTIPVDEAPLVFSVWELPPSRTLTGSSSNNTYIGRPWTYVRQEIAEKFLRQVAEETGSAIVSLRVDKIDRKAFLRFVAKVAHAYAVAVCGIGGFLPLLSNIILCRSDDFETYIGCEINPVPPLNESPGIFDLHLGNMTSGPVKGYLLVKFSLMSKLGAPAYIIIVGRSIENNSTSVLE